LSDNKILVIPAELIQKIDENRGDTSRAEFIETLIDNLLGDKPQPKVEAEYVTRLEFASFQQDIRQLLKNFLDFFVSYGMELGENGQQIGIDKFTSKLQGLQKNLGADNEKSGKATIKWK
jgi:hypothetical protein